MRSCVYAISLSEECYGAGKLLSAKFSFFVQVYMYMYLASVVQFLDIPYNVMDMRRETAIYICIGILMLVGIPQKLMALFIRQKEHRSAKKKKSRNRIIDLLYTFQNAYIDERPRIIAVAVAASSEIEINYLPVLSHYAEGYFKCDAADKLMIPRR